MMQFDRIAASLTGRPQTCASSFKNAGKKESVIPQEKLPTTGGLWEKTPNRKGERRTD